MWTLLGKRAENIVSILTYIQHYGHTLKFLAIPEFDKSRPGSSNQENMKM